MYFTDNIQCSALKLFVPVRPIALSIDMSPFSQYPIYHELHAYLGKDPPTTKHTNSFIQSFEKVTGSFRVFCKTWEALASQMERCCWCVSPIDTSTELRQC